MSKRRTNISEFVRLFDAAVQPVYVLDEDFTIVFLNRACRKWLGAAAEEMIGQRCRYHSDADESARAAADRLCPPPRVLAGDVVATAVCVSPEGGKFAEYFARFIPLRGRDEEPFAIVAVVETEERKTTNVYADTGLSEAGSIALHERILRFRRENAARYRADRLIGEGAAMQLARRQVELAAACRSSVSLVGPSGSGRRRLAAAIHYGAGEDESTLVTLDCSLLGADLSEALGLIIAKAAEQDEQSAPRTLLFHRVDELPAETQMGLDELLDKYLCEWRLLSTSAEPLGELVRRGKFLDRLAATLGVITIELPSLADRREDIPLLAQLFLEERNAAGDRQIGGFSESALDRLDAYRWPGNLDELASAVAEAHAHASGREITPADLPERLRIAAQAAARPHRVEERIVLDEFLGRVERELIRRALARSKGNKARAARLLGVTRPRLYRRMVQLGLE